MNTEAQYPAIVLAMGDNTGIEIPPQVIAGASRHHREVTGYPLFWVLG